MIVMMIAITPSLNASSRFLCIAGSLLSDFRQPQPTRSGQFFTVVPSLLSASIITCPLSSVGDYLIMITVLGLSGSLRAGSFNTALLRAAADLMPQGAKLLVKTIHGIPV